MISLLLCSLVNVYHFTVNEINYIRKKNHTQLLINHFLKLYMYCYVIDLKPVRTNAIYRVLP